MSNNESKPSTSFIDLSTYGQLEKSIYGNKSYFVRETIRSSWFTQIPIKMNLDSSNPNFNQTFTAEISRNGDYLMNAWLRVTLNAVSIYTPSVAYTNTTGKGSETITWTPNFMHNLVEQCSFRVNGMIIDEIYSEHLDFLTAFMIPKGSRGGYNRMIGNFCSPYNGLAGINVCGTKARDYPNLNTAQNLFLPLPFFFSRDTGVSLPMAALPYSKAEIKFKLRDWKNLMASISADFQYKTVELNQLKGQIPKLSDVQVWGNYAIVSKRERSVMGCKPRDMIIEQNQQIGGSYGSKNLVGDSQRSTTTIDLRLNGSVKAIFFAARNLQKSINNPYRSCYSFGPNVSDIWTTKMSIAGTSIGAKVTNSKGTTSSSADKLHINWFENEIMDYSGLVWKRDMISPIGTAKILYENTPMIEMEGLYYSLIQPYYSAKNIPQSDSNKSVINLRDANEVGGITTLANGYHMYSYALNMSKIDPNGSVNYGRLSNASLVLTPTNSTVTDISSGGGPYRMFISAINHNVIRISGGTMGFPIS